MDNEWPKTIPSDLESHLTIASETGWQSAVRNWLRTHFLDRFEEWLPLLKIRLEAAFEYATSDLPSPPEFWPIVRAWLIQIGARPPQALSAQHTGS
ncbi:MAG: hypothetical protein AAGD43_29255 [Pseudomonadota bacterium]